MVAYTRSLFAQCKGFCGLYPELSKWNKWLLTAMPFVLLFSIYIVASQIRHNNNPDDKLLPTISQMFYSFSEMAFVSDPKSGEHRSVLDILSGIKCIFCAAPFSATAEIFNGEYRLFSDTFSSLKRIFCGTALSAAVGLFAGLHMGIFPAIRFLCLGFSTFISIIPPLAILPILFMIFGVDEAAKVALIFIGTCPLILRDVFLATSMLSRDHITKALTLGSTHFNVVYRIALPQIMPRLINTIRLSLGSAWLFLLAAEFIASTNGLGYRIYLMRRFLAMDVIIPYVLWITLLGFFCDWLLRRLMKWKYKWYLVSQEQE